MTDEIEQGRAALQIVKGSPAPREVVQAACSWIRISPGWFGRSLLVAGGLSLVPLLASIVGASLPGMLVFGPLPLTGAGVLLRMRKRAAGVLRVEPRHLVVPLQDGRHPIRIPRSSIEDGFATEGRVVLHLRDGSTVELGLEGEGLDDPRRVLGALGLTLDRSAVSAPLRGLLGGFTRGIVAFATTLLLTPMVAVGLHFLPLLFAAPLLAIAAAIFVPRWLRPRLVIGRDGVRIAGTLLPRFLPYSEIKNVTRAASQSASTGFPCIVLETTGGALELPLIGQSDDEVRALVTRILEGRNRYLESASQPIALLERGGRSSHEWADAIRAAVVGSGFRDVALSRRQLEQVVADPKEPLERRVGAALGITDTIDGRDRVSIAAKQAAHPRTRAALELVLRGAETGSIDDQALEGLLALDD